MGSLETRMASTIQIRTLLIFGIVAALCSPLGLKAATDTGAIPDSTKSTALDRGYLGLYNLDFTGAQKDFSAWEAQHPEDPVGPVSEAAGYLFSEFNRLGVLEAQFYENDNAFAGRSTFTADPAAKNRFMNALSRAETLARARLAKNP